MIDPTAFVHPGAEVDDSVSIGARTKVWQFATVIRGTILGDDCSVGAGACLDGPHFGDGCVISPGVDMGPGFRIGNGVFIGPHVVLFNDFWPRAHKRGFDYEGLRDGSIICVIIKDGASLGAGVKVNPGITIGKSAMVASGAIVKTNVPENCLYTVDDKIRAFRREPKRMKSC